MAVRIYGNREIKTLPGDATRPTSARVREAVFNIWQGRILGCRWLDLCAGSGAMGAEALCRGAAVAVGIEKSGAACQVVTENWQKVLKPEQTFQVLKGDVIRQLTQLKGQNTAAAKGFDCIYFDPPYAGGLYDLVLAEVVDLLSPQAQIAVEYSEAHWQPQQLLPTLTIVKEKRYGSTHLVFLRRR
ncbi:MAG: 16S rRNA (guanine(966)-N(2))-methyltransferase RsmD [Cyanobacteria bacterium J06598_3]